MMAMQWPEPPEDMPPLEWRRSRMGGWFATDADGNRWQVTDNMELVTVTTPEGRKASGWTMEQARRALNEVA